MAGLTPILSIMFSEDSMRRWDVYVVAAAIAFCGSVLAVKIINGKYADLRS